MGSIVRSRDGYVLFVLTPFFHPSLLSLSCPFFFVVLELRAQPRRCFKFFLAEPHPLPSQDFSHSFASCVMIFNSDAPFLSPLPAWLGFAVLEASPLHFILTRSAAFYPFTFYHSAFDPQASYTFLGALLSSRSEHALLTVSRCLDSGHSR